MSSFPVCGTKEARDFGACMPADAVHPHAGSIPPCNSSDPTAFDICLSRDEDAAEKPADIASHAVDEHEDVYEKSSASAASVPVKNGLIALAGVGAFATALYAIASDRTEAIQRGHVEAANDNGAVETEVISASDLPEMDPREELAFTIRGTFPKISENRARLIANAAWVRWMQVPATTREQLKTWSPIVSYAQASAGDAVPKAWLSLYVRSVLAKKSSQRRHFESKMSRMEAAAASRVMWVSDVERASGLKIEARVIVDEAGERTMFNDDLNEALKGERWFRMLPEDARIRVISALAGRALELSRETKPQTVEVIPMGVDFIMDTVSKTGITVAFSHDGAELPSFAYELTDRRLPNFDDKAHRDSAAISREGTLPTFTVESSGELELRRTLSMVSEVEMKMEQMADLAELAPSKRRELAKRYLVQWQELSAHERATLVKEAHARGDFCMSEGFLTVPSKSWIFSRFHAEREALRLADYFKDVEALSRSAEGQERAIARTWNILSEKVKRDVFGSDQANLKAFIGQKREDVEAVQVHEARAKVVAAAPRIPTAAIVRELVTRHHISRQEAFFLVTTQKTFFREVMASWERYPAKNSFERGFAQFAAQRTMEVAATTPARGGGADVRGTRKDRKAREFERFEWKGMPKIERPGGGELPRFSAERGVK